MKFTKLMMCAGAVMSLYGCANVQVPAPVATAANVSAAKQMTTSVNVGAFKPASGLTAGANDSLSVRGSNTLNAPSGKGFSGHLRDVLVTEVRSAGKFDEASGIVITGELTKSELEAGMSEGVGTIAARFKVTRPEGVCLDKELTATAKWESSFVAAVAVPAAFNHYMALFPELAGKLLTDADFKQRCVSKP